MFAPTTPAFKSTVSVSDFDLKAQRFCLGCGGEPALKNRLSKLHFRL
jgi:hypothetical protein